MYTCFAGAPFVGRGVEGWEAPAPVKEEARVMFSLWSVFIGNFVLCGFGYERLSWWKEQGGWAYRHVEQTGTGWQKTLGNKLVVERG